MTVFVCHVKLSCMGKNREDPLLHRYHKKQIILHLREWTYISICIFFCNMKNPNAFYLSLFLELKSTSSLAYTFLAILVAWSLLERAFDTNTMNHSRSSFWTINLSRGFRIVLNSSRSCSTKSRCSHNHIVIHNLLDQWGQKGPKQLACSRLLWLQEYLACNKNNSCIWLPKPKNRLLMWETAT